ncbi:MAG: DUF1828 domain-containing protein [Thermoplasmata archaeon]|nr:DUF1828 domain-containing protein [Thermoplasmata archaeon]
MCVTCGKTADIANPGCPEFTLESMETGRFLVHTEFMFPDGDELHIVLRRRNDDWELSDEGHTLMWLSYEEPSLASARMDILEEILDRNHSAIHDGRISVPCDGREFRDCLPSMIRTLMQTADILG